MGTLHLEVIKSFFDLHWCSQLQSGLLLSEAAIGSDYPSTSSRKKLAGASMKDSWKSELRTITV